MMNTKRTTVYALTMLVLGMVFALASAQDTTTLHVWDYYGSTSPINETTVAVFESENPGVTVKVEALGFAAFFEKLPLALTSGEVPDVVTTGLMWAPQYMAAGAYADLLPLSHGMLNGQPFEAVLPKGMLDAGRVGDAIVGMPFDFDAYAYYYRKDLFDAAGVTEIPTSWDGLAAALADVTDDSQRRSGILVDATWNSWDPVLYAFGGRYLDADGKAVFNSDEAVASLEFLRKLVADGVGIVPAPGEYTSLLTSSQAASFYNGPYMMGVLRTAAPDLSGDWRVASLPIEPEYGTHIGGTHLAIMEGSQNKELAWKFVEFMMRNENQEYLWTVSGAAPGLIPAMEGEVVSQPDPYFGDQITIPVFKQAINDGIPNPTVEAWTQVADVVNKALQQVLLNGADVQTTLDAAVADANKILDN